jgi:capsular polysaccharide biosynthesis protein
LKLISVNPPKNLSKEDEHLFKPFLTYKLDPVTIKRLKNVFVTYSGLCIDKKGLVKESHHDYPDQYNDYLQEAARYFRISNDKPENLIRLKNDQIYLLIHHPWSKNYYHWICESILRVWMAKDALKDMVLLLPSYNNELGFIKRSLEPFNFKNIYFIPYKKCLYIEDLCMPQIKPVVDGYDSDKVKQIRAFYLKYVLIEKKIFLELGERIYISRRKAARKKIYNEGELEGLLRAFNFTIINAEEFTFFEQISIFSNASYLISIHGSGLTNMLFMQEKAHVLEFHKKKTNGKDWHSLAFWYLADCLGHYYYHQLCDPTDLNADYFNADFIVDIKRFEENLGLMLPNG